MHGLTPPTWHPDAFRRYELRYWDGTQWTHHVSSRGVQQVDPPVYASTPVSQPPVAPQHGQPMPTLSHQVAVRPLTPPPTGRTSKKVQRQIARAGLVSEATIGGGSRF